MLYFISTSFNVLFSGEETVNTGPCYLGICLPQRLVDLFPDEEDIPKSEILFSDNNADSTAGKFIIVSLFCC